jgi:type IV secretion system protein VirB10
VIIYNQEALKKTAAPQVEVTISGDPATTIFQGKMIDAVLETAINTDLPGNLRAIVSRDIYAEEGNEVMIPKGSRLVGTYNTEVKRGQARVLIIWNRVIRPDGVDVAIASPGVDSLGRSGMAGDVDNKFLEVFGNSVLLSSLSVAFAYGTETVTGSEGTTETRNQDGSRTVSGTNVDSAVKGSVDNFTSTAKGFIGDYAELRPTITVDQGAKLKVFVNRDLIFPDAARSQVKVLRGVMLH